MSGDEPPNGRDFSAPPLVTEVDGVGELVKPDHYPAANAVGAAIAQISGEVDRVFSMAEMTRDEAVATAKREATERAVAAGRIRRRSRPSTSRTSRWPTSPATPSASAPGPSGSCETARGD